MFELATLYRQKILTNNKIVALLNTQKAKI